MSPDMVGIVNHFQKYTIGELEKREVYKIYLDLLPPQRLYLKYVKGNGPKFNKELVDFVRSYYEVSGREAKDYIEFYKGSEGGKETLKLICLKYGQTEKQIVKLMK